VHAFANPTDINWRNVTIGEKYIGVKRTAIVVGSFLILIFITTPTALVQLFSGTEDIKLFWISWAQSESPTLFNRLLVKILPPLTVILINQVLLYIIYILGSRGSQQLTGKVCTATPSTRRAS
jgi:hypothetical protein